MTVAEAKSKLDAVLDEWLAAGFSVHGWDDGTIQIWREESKGAAESADCDPRIAW